MSTFNLGPITPICPPQFHNVSGSGAVYDPLLKPAKNGGNWTRMRVARETYVSPLPLFQKH